jgi:hypothetical protein
LDCSALLLRAWAIARHLGVGSARIVREDSKKAMGEAKKCLTLRPLGVYSHRGFAESNTPGASRQGADTKEQSVSYLQQMEEADFAASAGHDRFDGFDRGDTGREDDCPYFDLTVDEELPNGSRLQVAEWHGGVAEGCCEVRMNGRMVSETWDRDRAHAIAAWWRGGCQS